MSNSDTNAGERVHHTLNGILEIFRDALRGDLRSFCDLELIGVKL